MHVLILGGTTEARALAGLLHGKVRVTSSLAGRVASPRLPAGEVRIGGFGGVDGLVEWMAGHAVDAVIDATHPFAERISFNAARAAATAHVPLLALRRPGWVPVDGDDWRPVASLEEAARTLDGLGDRVFLTTGRMGLAAFAACPQWFLVRSVDAPDTPGPPAPSCSWTGAPSPWTASGSSCATTASTSWSRRTAAARRRPRN